MSSREEDVERPENSASTHDGTPVPDDACRPSPPFMHGVMLYWLAVATFGIYLPFWVYRFSRATGATDRERWRCIAWAIGVVAPPACWGILREFQRVVHESEPGRGRGFRSIEVPAALYLILLVVAGLSPLRHFILTPMFLLPIPFVLVQHSANRAGTASVDADRPRRRVPLWQWIAAPIGTVLVAAIVWLESPAAFQRLRPHMARGAEISGSSKTFRLTMPGDRWRRVAPGTIGEPESDLELTGSGADTWLIAFVVPQTDSDLHSTVDFRRAAVFSDGKPLEFSERRFFLEDSDFIPVSVADYRIDFGFGMKSVYHILTAETDQHVIEVIGYTAEPASHLEDLKSLVSSFSTVAVAADSGDGP